MMTGDLGRTIFADLIQRPKLLRMLLSIGFSLMGRFEAAAIADTKANN
jgi:hypothetical protein